MSKSEPIINWKQYEIKIHKMFQEEFPNAEIRHNTNMDGRYSKSKRQVDILIEDYVAGNKIIIVIDTKYFQKKIDVKIIDGFIGMLSDIGAHKGLIITEKGYSDAAIKRAYNDPLEIELDVLNFNQLKHYQGSSALAYAGGDSVLVSAPFGWVIDIRTTEQWIAVLYQRGLDLEKAQRKNEWMFINFYNRRESNITLDDLIKKQNNDLKKFYRSRNIEIQIEVCETIRRRDATTKTRSVSFKEKPFKEVTGFVEFEDFIFYTVLFTPIELSKKNVRKLENLIKTILPGKITV